MSRPPEGAAGARSSVTLCVPASSAALEVAEANPTAGVPGGGAAPSFTVTSKVLPVPCGSAPPPTLVPSAASSKALSLPSATVKVSAPSAVASAVAASSSVAVCAPAPSKRTFGVVVPASRSVTPVFVASDFSPKLQSPVVTPVPPMASGHIDGLAGDERAGERHVKLDGAAFGHRAGAGARETHHRRVVVPDRKRERCRASDGVAVAAVDGQRDAAVGLVDGVFVRAHGELRYGDATFRYYRYLVRPQISGKKQSRRSGSSCS